MAGLDPAIHGQQYKTFRGCPGQSPGMTINGACET
jgi:hypothetical protein